MAIESINPANGELIKVYRPMDEVEVETALDEVCLAWREWRRTGLDERSGLMQRAAVVLRESVEEYAALMTSEMGKPIAQARAEIEKCATACEFYAEHAAAFLAPEEVETGASRSFVAYEPIGPVLAVMPWNFPFWQVFRFAAPALMAGNAGVLKHASNVCGCALAIEAIFRAAGFPAHLFRTLVIGSAQVGAVVDDRRVAAITLTGSTPAGQAVASRAGQKLKKTVLELGGSDPYVVLADADLDLAVEACVTGRLQNTGQSCIAAKRFIVVDEIHDEFQERVLAAMSAKRFGDPMDEDVDLGPMARQNLRDELHDQVERSVEAGARCLLGGEIPDRPGAFYPPTLLSEVGAGMPAYHEELFGPVATLIRAADEAEAIMIANDTTFGLGAAVFTSDIERGTEIAQHELQAGCCFVNDFVRSDPRLPFGGIRESGYGRELGVFGIREFVNIKTVYVR
ncbi:MAG: NAD-dependent succinate-semialdehyde dehydrogenase [Gammaproteobacteria bacterium]|jgi:succinate-semialdehyde dehydrogenase/glutarate-semialdehyde dehydrogenase